MTWGRAALAALIVVEIVAVGSGRLSLAQGGLLLVAVEALVALAVVVGVLVRARGAQGPFLARLESGLAAVMPSVLARLVVGELSMARGLVLAVRGRLDTRGPGDVPIPYARGRLVMPLILGGLAIVELVAVDLLVPWHRLGSAEWLRWLVLALGLYGLLWIVAWCASERSHPHLATTTGLVLRRGPFVAAEIPWGLIEAARVQNRWTPDDSRTRLDAPMNPSNLDVDLIRAVPTRGLMREGAPSAAFSLAVDDAPEAARLITARAAAEAENCRPGDPRPHPYADTP